ncbi:MAG: hypothetical protein ABGX27_03875, partial [Desulfurobacteriaceae bacterium]
KREFLITLFRKGDLKKIYISYKDKPPQEIDFLSAVELLETEKTEERIKIPVESFYELLSKNKIAFERSLQEEKEKSFSRKDLSRTEQQILKELNA